MLRRIFTAGSVDDGKSTLIGRLLLDSGHVHADQRLAVTTAHRINLAHLADGLREEREKGITIDVAHRYFAHRSNDFILYDCPGHEIYTRNMVSGASHADTGLILVDALRGFREQSKRHLSIAVLAGIKNLVILVNKMDAAEHSQSTFIHLCSEITQWQQAMETTTNSVFKLHFIPISALNGDNVFSRSAHMPWYSGPTLVETLMAQAEVTVPPSHDWWWVQSVYDNLLCLAKDNRTLTVIMPPDAPTLRRGDIHCLTAEPLIHSKSHRAWFIWLAKEMPPQELLLRVGTRSIPFVMDHPLSYDPHDHSLTPTQKRETLNQITFATFHLESQVPTEALPFILYCNRGIVAAGKFMQTDASKRHVSD